MNNTNIDYSLYMVTDRRFLEERDLIEILTEAIRGGVKIVQLREKNITTNEFYQLACKVRKVTFEHNIPLIINDRVDIALAVDADGVHLGQDDMPASVARKMLGLNKILGVSVQNENDARKAQENGADYLGVGSVFPTSTKMDAVNVTTSALRDITSKVDIPVVAIGGINSQNIVYLHESGIDGVAVVSAILKEMDVYKAAVEMRNIVDDIILKESV